MMEPLATSLIMVRDDAGLRGHLHSGGFHIAFFQTARSQYDKHLRDKLKRNTGSLSTAELRIIVTVCCIHVCGFRLCYVIQTDSCIVL